MPRYVQINNKGEVIKEIAPPYEINVPDVWIPVSPSLNISNCKYIDNKWIENETVTEPSETEQIMLAITDMYEIINAANSNIQEDVSSLMLALADIYENELDTSESVSE